MRYALLSILIVVIILFSCGKQISGNVTQTGNPVGLRGQFFLAGGSKPAGNIPVTIFKRTSLADTGLHGGTKPDIRLYFTDEKGFFFEENIDTGLYVVEAFSGDTLKARVDSVHIEGTKEVVICDTLKQTGTICGAVYLSEGGDARKVFILVYGSNIVMTPDSSGSFCINGVAEGTYDLRIVPSIDSYDVLERKKISVTAGKVVVIDTLIPRFNGLPTVKNMKLEYDTAGRVALLSWDRADSSVAKGYSIYRRSRETNSSFQKIVTLPVQDISYRDSSIRTDENIEYTIVTVDKNGNEGMKAAAVSFSGKTFFNKPQLFSKDSTFQEITDIFLLPENRLAVVDFAGNQVSILDSTGKTVRRWGKKGAADGEFNFPVAGAVDDSGFVYILELLGEGRVQKFDTLGNFCDKRVVTAGCTDLDFYKGRFFVTGSSSDFFIQHFSFISPLEKIQPSVNIISSWSCIDSEIIYVGDQLTDDLKIITSDGILIKKLSTFGKNAEHFFGIGEIVISPKGYLCIADQNNGKIHVFSKELSYLESLVIAEKEANAPEVEFEKRPRSIAFDNCGNIYVGDSKRIFKCKNQ